MESSRANSRRSVVYKRILVPLDGSPLAEAVLPHVEALAPRIEAEIVLIQVLPATGVLAEIAQREEETTRSYLERVVKRLQAEGLQARFTIRYGESASEILDYAEVNDVDLIATSTHGRSGISRWVFGSIAEKILRGTNIPILLVRAPGVSRAGLPTPE
jgi:nucleotide-binding universal stress UspA family protein